jgi:hypothetical protein
MPFGPLFWAPQWGAVVVVNMQNNNNYFENFIATSTRFAVKTMRPGRNIRDYVANKITVLCTHRLVNYTVVTLAANRNG